MIKLRIRGVDDEVTGTSHFETEVDVVKCHRQPLLIEPAHRLENITPRHEARAGHRTVVPRHLQLTADAGGFGGETAKGVLRNSADPDNDSRVLNGVVAEKQARPDR